MSGSSHGKSVHQFINCRIGTNEKINMLYTPAHIRPDGKAVSARLVIPVLVNEYGKNDPDSYRLVAWGALADMFAKNLSKGKEMTFFADGSSYWGNVFYADGNQVLQGDGSALQTRQTSFTIRGFLWGADSNNTITEETLGAMKSGEGRRPAQWNQPGSPDNQVWKQLLERRKQSFYQGGERFGYARVVAPRGGGQILLGDQSKILRNQANGQLNTGGQNGGNLVNQVQNTFTQPNVNVPQQNAPVYNAPAYGPVNNTLPPVQGQIPTYGQPNTRSEMVNNGHGLPTHPA